jgi:cholesterol transport system auxiliary component
MAPRYFSPVSEHSQRANEPRAVRLELRPGQFESAAYLEERIAYRLSETELGYYDDRRWTELPEQFMRRELLFELFERRGLRHIVTGRAPMLDVELARFEYIRYGKPRARVELAYSIRDERGSLRDGHISAEQLVDTTTKDDAQAFALAMSHALTHAVRDLVNQVVEVLQEPSQEGG